MEFEKGITIIGSGNLAWHLAACLKEKSISTNMVISRTEEHARELGRFVGCQYSTQLSDLPTDTCLTLICTSDDVVESIALQLIDYGVPIAHTAASIPISVFKGYQQSGVLYPFQTFTKGVRMGELEIPFFIEANSGSMYKLLESLAIQFSDKVFPLKSEERKFLHVSGIMVNNFSNFFFAQGFDLLRDKGLNPEYLIPLIKETVHKLDFKEPKELQTGPAKRGSLDVVNSHIELLKNNPEIQELYRDLSNRIFEYYKKLK